MLKRSLYSMCLYLFFVILFPGYPIEAQNYLVHEGQNTINVHIHNLHPLETMTGVELFIDAFSDWMLLEQTSFEVGDIAPSSVATVPLDVPVALDTPLGKTGSLLLRMTEDHGHVWTAVEKSALEIEVEVGYPDGIFLATYDKEGEDFGNAIDQTHDGGYIVAGSTNSFQKGQRSDQDVLVMKLDAAGAVEWQATYGGKGRDEAADVHETGRIMVTDETITALRQAGVSSEYLALLAQHVAGTSYFSRTRFLADVSLCVDARSIPLVMTYADYQATGYIVAGTTASFGAGGEDIWLLKLDRSGRVLWQTTYGSDEDERAEAIRPTNDGGYILAGTVETFIKSNPFPYPPTTTYNAWLLKILPDSTNLVPERPTPALDGRSDWDIQSMGLDSPSPSAPTYTLHSKGLFAVSETDTGGYIAAGMAMTSGAYEGDFWVVSLDQTGTVLWQKIYGGPAWDVARDIRQTRDGGYIVAGMTDSFGVGAGFREQDVWMLKLDQDGHVGEHFPDTWQRTYGNPDWDDVAAIQQTDDGGYILAGQLCVHPASNGLCTATQNGWLLKMDQHGSREWERIFGGHTYTPLMTIQPTLDSGYAAIGGYQTIVVLITDDEGNASCAGEPVTSQTTETAVTGANAQVEFQARGANAFTIADTAVRPHMVTGKSGYTAEYQGCAEEEPLPVLNTQVVMRSSTQNAFVSAVSIIADYRDGSRQVVPITYTSRSAVATSMTDHDSYKALSDATAVPEPGTLLLVGAGLIGLLLLAKRRWNG